MEDFAQQQLPTTLNFSTPFKITQRQFGSLIEDVEYSSFYLFDLIFVLHANKDSG